MDFVNQHVLENPSVLLVALFVVSIVAVVIHRAHGWRIALWVAIGGGAAMLAVLLLATFVQTDAERVAKVLEDVRQAMLARDAPAFGRHISPRFRAGPINADALNVAVAGILSTCRFGRLQTSASRSSIRVKPSGMPTENASSGGWASKTLSRNLTDARRKPGLLRRGDPFRSP